MALYARHLALKSAMFRLHPRTRTVQQIKKLLPEKRGVHELAFPPSKPDEELYNVTFIDQKNKHHKFAASRGDNLLNIARLLRVELEGACGGECACSTCHVVVTDGSFYNRINKPKEDEIDMLDTAKGLTETSRLGCQVRMMPDLDGLVVKVAV